MEESSRKKYWRNHPERMIKEKQYGQNLSQKLGFHSFPELMTNFSSGSLFLDFFSETFPYLKMFNQLEGQSVQKSEIMQCRTAQVYRNQRNGDLIFRNKIVSNLSYQAKEN